MTPRRAFVLDGEPALRRLVFVEALGAGPRVLARRAEVSEQLAGVIDEGRAGMKAAGELPPLTAQGIVGGAFGLIHAPLAQERPESLMELLNPLMAMIVLPYRGRAAATRELKRPLTSGRRGAGGAGSARSHGRPGLAGGQAAPPIGGLRPLGSIAPADFRLTVRTQMVLAAVAELGERGSNPNNREVSELAGISDQGQISRLMIRLAEQGLLENTREQTHRGHAKAWRLTAAGKDVVQANPPLRAEHRVSPPAQGGSASSRVSRSPRRGRDGRPGSGAARRVTDRTRLVLSAVAELGTRDFAPSNRQVSRAAGVRDQGQISKLLGRLEQQGLVQNSGGQTQGIPNAWRLTPHGEEIVHASQLKEPTR
jgi:DNA-binding MarR family transcriptional regulator